MKIQLKKLSRSLGTFLVIMAVAAVTRETAAAQELNQLDINLSPSVSFLKLQPGSTATHTISVENKGTREVTVQPKIVDFASDNQTGLPVLQAATSFPYFDSAVSELAPLTLKPGSVAQVALEMTVPAGAPNTEYPMTVLFETPQSSSPLFPGQVVSQAQVGSNLVVLVTSETNTVPQVSIKSIQTTPVIDSFRPLTFTPLVKNQNFSGTVASGSAQVLNWRGTVIAEFELPPQVILGNASREILASDPDFVIDPLAAEPRAPALLQPSVKRPFLFGPYWITTTIQAGTDEFISTTSATHIVVALPISLLAALVIIAITWFTYLWLERKKHTE